MLNEVIGICPKCNTEKKLVSHLFSGQEVASLCSSCENEIKQPELSSELIEIGVMDLFEKVPVANW